MGCLQVLNLECDATDGGVKLGNVVWCRIQGFFFPTMYKCLKIWNPQNPFRPAANLFGRRSFCVLGTEVSKC